MLSTQLNQLLQIAGTNNKYQFIVLFLFTVIFITTDFFLISLPFIEMGPYVDVTYKNQSKTYGKLNYDICLMKANNTLGFTIDTVKNPQSSLVIDMASYCNKNITSLIGIAIFSGLIVGSCIASLFADRFGRRNTLITVYPIYIAVLVLFYFVPNLNWMIFSLLFIIGLLSSIITIDLITYLCEIIKPEKVEVYITILVSGTPLGGFAYSYFFYLCSTTSWRYILFGTSGVGILIYIAVLAYVKESPIYYLNNGNIRKFKVNLKLLARKNNTSLLDEDFDFLPLPQESPKLLPDPKEEEYVAAKDPKSIRSSFSKSSSAESDFWKMTMRNYTPFDLIRYRSQLTNFFVLSFLWALNTIILHGLDIYSRNLEFERSKVYHIFSAVFFFANLLGDIAILVFILFNKFDPHHFLQCFQLISLTFFLLTLILTEDLSPFNAFSIVLYCTRWCWYCMDTILNIISAKIYPSMLRTKGLSYNRAIGVLCGITGPYLIEKNMEDKAFILYYIVLAFFGIVFTYVLPEEYESIYQVPENEKKEDSGKDKEDKDSKRTSIIFQISDVHFDAKIIMDDDNDGKEEEALKTGQNKSINDFKPDDALLLI